MRVTLHTVPSPRCLRASLRKLWCPTLADHMYYVHNGACLTQPDSASFKGVWCDLCVCESEFPVKRNSLSSNPQHTSIAVSQNQTTQGFDNPPCQDVQDADYYRTDYCYFVTQHQTKSSECVFKSSRSLYSFSSCEQIELVLFLPAKVEGQTPGVA